MSGLFVGQERFLGVTHEKCEGRKVNDVKKMW